MYLYSFLTLFLFPQLKLSKPTRYFSRLSWARYKFLNRSSQQSPPKLIHKWSTHFENPEDNDSKFKDHFKVYRSTNWNFFFFKGTVQIHKINQNKCGFLFWKFSGIVNNQHLNACTMIFFFFSIMLMNMYFFLFC